MPITNAPATDDGTDTPTDGRVLSGEVDFGAAAETTAYGEGAFDPADDDADQVAEVETPAATAQRLIETQQYPEAAAWIDAALTQTPEDEALLALAETARAGQDAWSLSVASEAGKLAANEQFQAAADLLDAALARAPFDGTLAALEAENRAVLDASLEPAAALSRSQALIEDERIARAVGLLEAALERSPDDESLQTALADANAALDAWLEPAAALARSQELIDAERFERAVDLLEAAVARAVLNEPEPEPEPQPEAEAEGEAGIEAEPEDAGVIGWDTPAADDHKPDGAPQGYPEDAALRLGGEADGGAAGDETQSDEALGDQASGDDVQNDDTPPPAPSYATLVAAAAAARAGLDAYHAATRVTADTRALIKAEDFRAAHARVAAALAHRPGDATLGKLAARVVNAHEAWLAPGNAAVRAQELIKAGEFQRATDLALAALAKAPDDGELLLVAAEAEAAAGRYDDAIIHLDHGLLGNEHRAGLGFLRAKIAHHRDDQNLALRLLHEVELIEPFAVSPSILTARALAASGREDETWDILLEAVKARPSSMALWFSLARITTTKARFDTFYTLWLKGRDTPASFAKGVRPLLTACVRAREFGRYRMAAERGIEILLAAKGKIKPNVRDRTLGFGDGERALRDLVLELQKHGIPHFLAAGTCLGAVRAGRLLSFDTDIDIGIFEKDFDREQLTRIFRENPNFRLHDADPETPKLGLQHWNGLMVDLFPFVSRDGKVWHSGVFTEWWNTPFETQEIDLYDLKVSIPAEPDLYLTECYGDWRTPNPVFDAFYQGPNAVVIWQEYFDAYLLRRVFEIIAGGDLPLAVRYLRRFPRVFGWLDQKKFGLDLIAPKPDPLPVVEVVEEPEPEAVDDPAVEASTSEGGVVGHTVSDEAAAEPDANDPAETPIEALAVDAALGEGARGEAGDEGAKSDDNTAEEAAPDLAPASSEHTPVAAQDGEPSDAEPLAISADPTAIPVDEFAVPAESWTDTPTEPGVSPPPETGRARSVFKWIGRAGRPAAPTISADPSPGPAASDDAPTRNTNKTEEA